MDARVGKSSVVLLGVLVLFLWSRSPALALEVRILDKATVIGSEITLGEVARFSDDNDPRVMDIKKIVIAQAPSAGKVMVLDGAYLNYRLRARLGKPDFNLVLPRQLEVKRQAREISGKDLEQMFTKHVSDNIVWPLGQVTYRDIRVPEVIYLPRGKLTHKIKPLGRRGYVGEVSLLVTFFVDGVRQRSVRISGQVDVRQEVVVARQDLKRHQEIGPATVGLQVMNMAEMPTTALTRVSEAIGMQTRQPIRTGELVLSRMLERMPLIKRGDRLVVVAESASLRVETFARALEDGYEGEQVRVVNSNTGRELYGRVVGPRQVAVDF